MPRTSKVELEELKHYQGARVEIPAWSDTWMRGARFGVIVRAYKSRTEHDVRLVAVRMDHPAIKRLFRCRVTDIAQWVAS